MAKNNNATIAEAFENPNDNKVFRTSPVGVAVYPHIIKIDDYIYKKEGKEVCNTQLRLDPSNPADAAFIEEIDAMTQEAFELGKASLQEKIDSGDIKGKDLAKAKKALKELVPYPPYEADVDEEGEETGLVVFKMKTQVAGVNKKDERWEREIPVFDSTGTQIKGAARASLKLYGGSRISVAVQVVPYCAPGLAKAGVSLRISAVQVIELSSSSAATADTFGFESSGGGFTADTFEAAAAGEDPDTGDDDEDDDEF